MADADDEYERERQENIRKNQELLLSLGLNASNGLKSSAGRAKKRREVEADVDADDSEYAEGSTSPPRTSERLRARPRTSFGPPAKKKAAAAARKVEPLPARVGSRRSSRLSDPDGKRKSLKDDEGSSVVSLAATTRGPTLTPLRRLQNPLPSRVVREEIEEEDGKEYPRAPLPTRDRHGNILFENKSRHFMPNVTPEEMLRGGIFGGTAFRPYFSTATGQRLNPDEDLGEFPESWYAGLDRETMLTSSEYDPEVNRYGVKAGQSLEEWEKSNWVRRQDPRGWWQWYFRFYLGRRSSDDARQISRFLKACGPSGRFKRGLVVKIHRAGAEYDDESISPVVRQTLFHWAYKLNQVDYDAYLP